MSSFLALPFVLSPPLSDRGAIIDALYRGILGLDTNDLALFNSAFPNDARLEFNGRAMDGVSVIRSDCFDHIYKLETTHSITNVRINISDDGSKASVSASALAQHYRAGTGKEGNAARLLTGAQYRLDLLKTIIPRCGRSKFSKGCILKWKETELWS